MSVCIHPKDNRDHSVALLDNTPLAMFMQDFMDLGMRHFDSFMGLYDGDFEIAPKNLRGLSKISELIDFSVENWEDFYSGSHYKVSRTEVEEFNTQLKAVLLWCIDRQVPLVHIAD